MTEVRQLLQSVLVVFTWLVLTKGRVPVYLVVVTALRQGSPLRRGPTELAKLPLKLSELRKPRYVIMQF